MKVFLLSFCNDISQKADNFSETIAWMSRQNCILSPNSHLTNRNIYYCIFQLLHHSFFGWIILLTYYIFNILTCQIIKTTGFQSIPLTMGYFENGPLHCPNYVFYSLCLCLSLRICVYCFQLKSHSRLEALGLINGDGWENSLFDFDCHLSQICTQIKLQGTRQLVVKFFRNR